MKIIVLHGEDTTKSYERLKKFIDVAKKRSWEVVFLDESNLALKENLSSSSLFGGERFFILKDIKKLTKKEIEWIKKNTSTLPGNLIIYHEGTIGAVLLKSLPKDSKIEEFKLPKLIWNFLEIIRPGNADQTIKTFHKVIEKEPIELVFALIARQMKDLYLVKSGNSSQIPSWRESKLINQASKFTSENLKQIIGKLTEIDVEVKTSKANLVSSLDLLLIKQLE